MPEEIKQDIIQDVPSENKVVEQKYVQDPVPKNAVYKFMKANNLTSLNEDDFIKKYSSPEKAKEIHSFMVTNNLTTLNDNDFYSKYFPAASTISVTDESGLKKKVQASSAPGLQNLLAFAKSGKNIGKEVSQPVIQQNLADKNQILAKNLVVPSNTREAVLAKRQENWNSLVDDAAFRAVEKTVIKNGKQGVSYTRDKIQGMVDDYKKKVKSGELIIAEDPVTGKNMLAIPDYNPLSSLLSSYNKGNEQKYEDAYFEGLSPEEKIKHKEVQQFVAQDDDSIPKLPAGIFGNLGGFGGQVINMLEKPIVYSIGLASGAGAAEAAALGTAELATAGGLSNVGNTLGFMSDMANSSYSPTWDKVYYGNLQGIENPTQQQKLEAANKATEAANYSKAVGGAEGLIFGIPFGSLSKTLEPTSKGFIDNLVANGKNTLKHAPQMVGTSIVGQIGKGEVGAAYGSKETQADIVKEGLSTGYETAKFLASMSGLNAVKAAVPYAFTLLANTKESPSKSLTAKAKAVVGQFPDEVIADIYNQAEQNGVIEPGKANEILNDIQKYREAEASVPETVTNIDARDAIAGKLEKLNKLDQELKTTKVNARKIEIEKEKAQVEKEIDNIYNGDDVLANEKDIAGNPLKERSEVGKAPVLAEEAVIKETPKAETKPVEEVKVTEEVKPTEVKEESKLTSLEKEYDSKSVDDLVKLKKELYPTPDIETPMTPEEKLLDRVIAKKFSEKQQEIIAKRKAAAEEVKPIEVKDGFDYIRNKFIEDVSGGKRLSDKESNILNKEVDKLIERAEKENGVKRNKLKQSTWETNDGYTITEFFENGRGGTRITTPKGEEINIFDNKYKGESGKDISYFPKAAEVKPTEVKETANALKSFDKIIKGNKTAGTEVYRKAVDLINEKKTHKFTGKGWEDVAEAYHKALKNGKNPELVELIDKTLVKENAEVKPTEVKAEAKPIEYTKDDLKNAEAKFATAKDKFEKTKAKLEASQVTQKGLFGGEQKGMFAAKAEEAKSILDPLRKAAKEAKTELDNIKNRIKVQEEAQQELKPVEKEEKGLTMKGVRSEETKRLNKEASKIEATDARSAALKYLSGANLSEEAINEVAGRVKRATLNTGAKELKSEEARSRDYVAKKGEGESLDEAAHSIWDNLSEEMQSKIDTQDVKNALMDAILENKTKAEAAKALVEGYQEKSLEDQELEFYRRYNITPEEADAELALAEESLEKPGADEYDLDVPEEHVNNLIKQYEAEIENQTKQPSEGIKEKGIEEISVREAGKPEKKLEEAYKDLTNIEKRQIINSKFEELLKELKIEKICPTD